MREAAAYGSRDGSITMMAMCSLVLALAQPLAVSVLPDGAPMPEQVPTGQRAADVSLNPAEPSFARFINEHAVEIEVRNTDGRVVRKGAGVISSDSGYVMTSLEVVVGGTEYLVAGPAVGATRAATALAVSKAGQIALLQLTGKPPAIATPARSSSPPQAGDRLYTAPPTGQAEAPLRPGKISAVRTERDGAVLLELDVRSPAGAAVYNSRGALVGIVRGGDQARPSNRAVFVPDRMPGDWVLYFPARVGDPIARKPISRPPDR